jgi:hypothetical protein
VANTYLSDRCRCRYSRGKPGGLPVTFQHQVPGWWCRKGRPACNSMSVRHNSHSEPL